MSFLSQGNRTAILGIISSPALPMKAAFLLPLFSYVFPEKFVQLQ